VHVGCTSHLCTCLWTSTSPERIVQKEKSSWKMILGFKKSDQVWMPVPLPILFLLYIQVFSIRSHRLYFPLLQCQVLRC
jgi:hypothetical protein